MSVPVPIHAPFGPIAETKPLSHTAPRFKLWHESLIDLILQHPDFTQKELAAAIGKSAVSVGMVMRSDMFQARLAVRRQEHNLLISQSIIAASQQIAKKSLFQLNEKLDENSVTKRISARDLGDIAREAMDRIGLGPKQPDIVVQTNVQATTTNVTVSQDALMRARGRLRQNEDIVAGRSEATNVHISEATNVHVARSTPLDARTIEAIVSEPRREAILDELMSIGDPKDITDVRDSNAPEGEQDRPADVASAAATGRAEG